MYLKGETALITGSTSGIGKKIAELFLKEGAKVTICSRNLENVNKTVAEFQDSFGSDKVIGFPCDVADISAITDVANKTVESFGSLRILVANAGLNRHYGPFQLLSHEEVQEDAQIILGANLIGTINSVSAVLPVMEKQKYGRIVTLSGAGGDSKRPMTNVAIYSASKGGIVSFSSCLAQELKSSNHDIKINIFQPGMIKTNLATNLKLVSGWIDEETFKKQNALAHEYIGTDINQSVPKIIPYVLPSCKNTGKSFTGFSVFKMIRGGMKLRGKIKNEQKR
ncbi:MAG: SDR family NAD(P)-dependent oxidoreductase [Candidatus Hodarchaeales archaeon]